MADFDMQVHLQNVECHFNWQLECSQSTLENLHQDLIDRLKYGCSWKQQLYNLLGYVLHVRGSSDEALEHLKEGEKMIKEQETEEQDCHLLVNQANLAWVHFSRGELAESQACLEEAERLQKAFLAPPGSEKHPDLSAEKGWALLKFERSHKQRAIECFNMALKGNPQKRHFHKGLALAMEYGYTESEITPELRREITDKLKIAKEMDENDMCVIAQYLIHTLHNSGEESKEEVLQQANALAQRLIASGNLSGLSNLLYLLMYHFKEYDKAICVAEEMLKQFPCSTRAKKNLASCLKWKVFSLWEESSERTALATRAIDLYKEVNTWYSLKQNIDLSKLYTKVGDADAADKIYQRLLEQEHFDDATRQLLYLRYGDYLYKYRKIMSAGIDMYIKAVQIPVDSDNRDMCIKRLASVVKHGVHDRCAEVCDFLLDLLCVSCRQNGSLLLKK